MTVEPGQIWEYCGRLTVLTLRPRPDLDAKYLPKKSGRKAWMTWTLPKGATEESVYWDVLLLHNEDEDNEFAGHVDWMGVGGNDWVKLS